MSDGFDPIAELRRFEEEGYEPYSIHKKSFRLGPVYSIIVYLVGNPITKAKYFEIDVIMTLGPFKFSFGFTGVTWLRQWIIERQIAKRNRRVRNGD